MSVGTLLAVLVLGIVIYLLLKYVPDPARWVIALVLVVIFVLWLLGALPLHAAAVTPTASTPVTGEVA